MEDGTRKATDMEQNRAYMSKINHFRGCISKRNIFYIYHSSSAALRIEEHGGTGS
jgi:hypothetical protein